MRTGSWPKARNRMRKQEIEAERPGRFREVAYKPFKNPTSQDEEEVEAGSLLGPGKKPRKGASRAKRSTTQV